MAWVEVWTRWKETVPVASAWVGVGVGLVGSTLCLVWLVRRASERTWRRGALGFAASAGLFAVYRSWSQAWLADDAFISFRYARNFAEGHGLVWNVGERVEGYTNFLWTFVLGVGERVGLTSPYLSTALTLVTLLAFALVATAALAKPGWVPLAPALLVLSSPFVEFGTSGLEAVPTAVCIALSALWLRSPARRDLAAWWVLVAALLRPDHVLFFVPLLLVQLRAGRRALAHVVAAGAVWAAWWCARWAWYGDFFPNTFHTKAGDGAYWTQGLMYWADLVLTTQLWLVVPGCAVLGVALWWRGDRPSAFGVYALLGATGFALYVARVGGDFMEYRFGLTTFALVALWADAVASDFARGRVLPTVLAVVVLLPLGLSPQLLAPGEKKWHLSRESSFYRVRRWFPLEVASGSFATGQALARLPDGGASAPPLAVGAIGMVGYLTHVPVVDMLGLTNSLVSHKVVTERGRPGHEKVATTQELISGGAQWSLEPGWASLSGVTRFQVQGLDVWVLQDTPAVRALGGVLDEERVLSAIDTPEDARAMVSALRGLLGSRPELLHRFEERWALPPAGMVTQAGARTSATGPCAAGGAVVFTGPGCAPLEFACTETLRASFECPAPVSVWLVPADPRTMALSARAALLRARGAPTIWSDGFDVPESLASAHVTRAGTAFEVLAGTAPRQNAVVGMQGAGLINGFAQGDGAQGEVVLHLPLEVGKPVLISFLLGGGARCDLLSVEVEGHRACGRDDEVLRTSAFLITPTDAVTDVKVRDASSGGWGHLLVDELRVFAADARNGF